MTIFNFITEEEQEKNAKVFMSKLDKIQSPRDLNKLRIEAFKAGSDKDGGSFYFMSQDDKNAFWAKYNNTRDDFAEIAIKELDEYLERNLSDKQLEMIKNQVSKSFFLDKKIRKDYKRKLEEKSNNAA